MGSSIIGALASAAVGVVTTVVQQRQAARAERAQREQRNISTASSTIKNISARRRAAKEERIRRARIIASSEASGVTRSSGQLGAVSALSSSYGASIAQHQSEILAIKGMNKASQKEADAISSYNRAGAFGKLFQQGIETGIDIYNELNP